MLPLITVEEDGNPICYRLPLQFSEWAFTMVAISNMGQNLFPSEVVFQKKKTIIMLILFKDITSIRF